MLKVNSHKYVPLVTEVPRKQYGTANCILPSRIDEWIDRHLNQKLIYADVGFQCEHVKKKKQF